MPSAIPYDHPSMILGNIVDIKVLNLLKQMASVQSKIDAAHDKLNSHIAMKTSLLMTVNELESLDVDTKVITDKIKLIDTAITKSASDYMDIRLANEETILKMREEIADLEIDDMLESPVDFSTSTIKKLPLSSESLRLDVQYFSYEDDSEASSDIMSNIETFVKESTEDLGTKSSEIAKKATKQVYQQQKNHNLVGTLIITASCTHKNVAMIEPLNLDVEKAINMWNTVKKKGGVVLEPDLEKMKSVEHKAKGKTHDAVSILSGVSYGSSFIGMVHFIKNETDKTNPSIEEVNKLQEKMRIGGWLENAAGGFGVDASISSDIKRMLNSYSVNSHVSLITTGAIPSIASNKLMSGISQLTKDDTGKIQESLKAVSDNITTQIETLATGNEKAKALNRMIQMTSTKEQSIMRSLGTIDSKANNVMDVNSLMTALENYIKEIKQKDSIVGAPINFYLKKITAPQIAKLWIDKYYPDSDNPLAKSRKKTQHKSTDTETEE